ncbi:MAG: zinc ribbon domain-containing protein [Ruminococcaceae bacterium]|nr:zinc ribbon domain-containing protein [Oscillospiraceae bacterium]
MYCSVCGKEVMDSAVICPGCGCMIKKEGVKTGVVSSGTNTKTQTSVILGIIGIVFAWLFALVGHVVSIIGIIRGIKDYKETEKMTGLILSIIGEACSIFSSIIGAVAMAGF